MNRFWPALLTALLCACTALPPVPGGAPVIGIDRAPFKPLDPGSYDQASLHFMVRTYGADNARRVSAQAEQLYRTIMTDTNLYSFMPSGLYEIVVYGTHDEYVAKTGQPEWTGGVAYGNAIYSYENPRLNETIAHEMTHLVFNEFMAYGRDDVLWLNEGLAVYEQNKAAVGKGEPPDIFPGVRDRLRAQPVALAEMLAFVPLEQKTADDPNGWRVTLWYAQAESMVQFLLDRGGRLGFSQLLQSLKDRKSYDAAFASSYPGLWNGLADFYAGWAKSRA